MNPLLTLVLNTLVDEGVRLGSGLVERGAQLVRDRLAGDVSDDAVLAWLRERNRA